MPKKLFLFAGSCLLLFFLIEGLSSTLLAVYGVWCARGSPEARYSRYDKELGWVSTPHYYRKDFYAPGVYLKTNAQGFRASQDFTATVPSGKVRIICSGDSFTFGYSVDNDHTWCQHLEVLDHRLQTVNIAESGYGLDQMYLRYKRDAGALDHDVLLFAFISDDFRRMQLRTFAGFGKPTLQIRNGELVAGNVPVPEVSSFSRWWSVHGHCIRYLSSLRLAERAYRSVFPQRDSLLRAGGPTERERLVVAKVIENLRSINRQRNSTLVLVYLPTKEDYEKNNTTEARRKFLQEEAAKWGILLVDLIGDFQKLSAKEIDRMFVCPESSQYFSAGHLTEEGNEFVAAKLYGRLISSPEIAAKLAVRAPVALVGAESRPTRQSPDRTRMAGLSAARASNQSRVIGSSRSTSEFAAKNRP